MPVCCGRSAATQKKFLAPCRRPHATWARGRVNEPYTRRNDGAPKYAKFSHQRRNLKTHMASIQQLLDIMATLRDPERGCPWDREQRFAPVAPHTIEEAYEVAAALERGDMNAWRGGATRRSRASNGSATRRPSAARRRVMVPTASSTA